METGSCQVGFDGNTYRHTGDGTNYLAASGYQVDGTESWIEASLRGLTLGGWFWGDVAPTTQALGISISEVN